MAADIRAYDEFYKKMISRIEIDRKLLARRGAAAVLVFAGIVCITLGGNDLMRDVPATAAFATKKS